MDQSHYSAVGQILEQLTIKITAVIDSNDNLPAMGTKAAWNQKSEFGVCVVCRRRQPA